MALTYCFSSILGMDTDSICSSISSDNEDDVEIDYLIRKINISYTEIDKITQDLDGGAYSLGNFPKESDNIPVYIREYIIFIRKNPLFMMDYYYYHQIRDVYKSASNRYKKREIKNKLDRIDEYVDTIYKFYEWSKRESLKR